MTRTIRFTDGAAYERYMGKWSRLAGDVFLRWLNPPPGLRWLDVGCGSGAFTEMVAEQCAPAAVCGIDPSAEQLAYARSRPRLQNAEFRQADAAALPFSDATFDVAVMPLVIFFLPVPITGVREMTRVVAPRGIVAAYAWDLLGGGFPYHVLLRTMLDMGLDLPAEPSPEASRRDTLHDLWTMAGLQTVDTTELVVERTFADFEDYWTTILGSASAGAHLRALSAKEVAHLQAHLRTSFPADAAGQIRYSARAKAVRGYVRPLET